MCKCVSDISLYDSFLVIKINKKKSKIALYNQTMKENVTGYIYMVL